MYAVLEVKMYVIYAALEIGMYVVYARSAGDEEIENGTCSRSQLFCKSTASAGRLL